LKERAWAAPPTPGEVLKHLLASERRITQDRLAKAMGVSRYSVNQLANDRRAVTAEMALRLAKALGTTPQLWLNLQREVDLHRAGRRLRHILPGVRNVRKRLSEAELFYNLPA